ncbi:hypothetical protein [Brucella intermedia]|uniref:hypothetical protein n=1 Tax=Brucella intermedia TaxID=94625 RepID=UPI00178C2B21|nr:hypothetical protein [Brucella intermedia]
MKIYGQFDDDGFPVAFYDERVQGVRKLPIYGSVPDPTEGNPNPVAEIVGYQDNPDCQIPAEAVEISVEQHDEFLSWQGLRRWDNGQVVEYSPPDVDPVAIIPAVTLWERMTDVEAEQVNAAMATQPFRTRQIFLTANTFRSDHELWPLLVQMATDLFGEERAAGLLRG